MLLKENQDKCFHKQRYGLPALSHMRYRSMTHVISTDLESETVCTFIAQVLDRYEDLLDTVVAECTIK